LSIKIAFIRYFTWLFVPSSIGSPTPWFHPECAHPQQHQCLKDLSSNSAHARLLAGNNALAKTTQWIV
jgi:hypothetical protein